MSGGTFIFVVDDDPRIRESFPALSGALGVPVRTYGDADAFLKEYEGQPGCLLLDLHLPGTNGFELMQELSRRGSQLPVVVFAADSETHTVVRAMKMGAVDYIQKPPAHERLLGSIRAALGEDRRRREHRSRVEQIMDRVGRLSPEEIAALETAPLTGPAFNPPGDPADAGAAPAAVEQASAEQCAGENDPAVEVEEDVADQVDSFAGAPGFPQLTPRLRQTLDHLLRGDSEKQTAVKLGLSRHTIHDYVKALHKQFGVNSRGELLAKCMWIRQGLRLTETGDATRHAS